MTLVRLWPVTLFFAIAGCSDNNRDGSSHSAAAAPALYGEPAGAPSTSIPRLRPFASTNSDWKSAPFFCLGTELSPATLFHSSTKYFGCFTQLPNHGLGAPSYAAFATRGGPRIFKNGEPMDASGMDECWVLVWFAGAPGWTNWDSPWVVYLQKRPTALALDQDGLHFQFAEAAGDVVLLPLYGYDKPPPPGRDFLVRHGLPGNKTKTWEWAKVLPRNVLMRIRYWASASREFPLYCEDSFSVDRSRDVVILRQKIEWRSIDDDWQTTHLKLAPVSPPLALAAKERRFPVQFSRKIVDLELPTPYGPYMAVEQADSFAATLKVLQYVNETEAPDPPLIQAHPTVPLALAKLQKAAREKFSSAGQIDYGRGGLENFGWAIQGGQWYAKALPYLDEPTRSLARSNLRKYFHEEVLVTNRFQAREHPRGSGRDYLIHEGPGISSGDAFGDAGRLSANLIETLWAYAHFTGDWDLIRERWPMVKKLFVTPAETRWVTFGREAIAEIGDEAAPCAAFARLAYKIGDLDSYNYGCALFARELVQLYVKQRGADYFRKHQPWHSMEFMDEEIYLTHLGGDVAGWQIDGPNYPSQTGERRFNHRWVRFQDSDVGRFYRDYLREEVKRELDRLQGRWEPERKYHNDSHLMPSLVQLRSLLLNESPAELATVATPEQFSGPLSGVIASCLSVIRTSHPTRYERLIPRGEPSPFVAGLERDVAGPNPFLLQAVQYETKDQPSPTRANGWPQITWWGWKTPTGERWTFGHVTPVREGMPGEVKVVPLNWNTEVVTFALP